MINNYTRSAIYKPDSNEIKIYLIPSQCQCLNHSCSGKELVLLRQSKTQNSVNVFTSNGVLEGEANRKQCDNCDSIYYHSYFEASDSYGSNIRSYYEKENEPYFSITNETFFEKKLLEQLTESVVTCNVQFTNWASAYNRLNSKAKGKIDKRRITDAWMIYSAHKRINVSFPVTRDKSRHLDVESICEVLYPKLRHHVDRKWFNHICHNCSTRLVVMDGDAKAYRLFHNF